MNESILTTDFLQNVAYKNSLGDFCAYYYNLYIKNHLSTDEGFQKFVLLLRWERNSNQTVEPQKYFQEEEYNKTTKNVLPIIGKIITNMIKENVSEKQFYSKLWECISDDLLFATELEKICVIISLILEPRVPYYELGKAVQMDNDKYQEISNSINTEISKTLFALRCGYSQNTEVASQIYKIMNETSDDEKKIVLLAHVIGYFNAKFEVLSEKILQSRERQEKD